MAHNELLADRVRNCLRPTAGVSEKKMFDGLHDRWPPDRERIWDGLIARIGAQAMDAAVAEPGVRPFDMTGRPMRGIVVIAGDVLDDTALERWIWRARSYVAGVPPK
jgi:hypothetical protein